MSGLVEGKVAVITGAGSGMGRAAVEILLRDGTKAFVAGAVVPVDGGWSARSA